MRRANGALALLGVWRAVNQQAFESLIEEIYAGRQNTRFPAGYALASMAMSPPRSPSMFKLCLSSNSIPTSGVLPEASASICLGWPSR